MRLALLAALGGALGTVARYLTVVAVARLFGSDFPWGTFAVNVSGSLAIGVLVAAIGQWFAGSAELRVLLVTGFLGGFTTFSAVAKSHGRPIGVTVDQRSEEAAIGRIFEAGGILELRVELAEDELSII